MNLVQINESHVPLEWFQHLESVSAIEQSYLAFTNKSSSTPSTSNNPSWSTLPLTVSKMYSTRREQGAQRRARIKKVERVTIVDKGRN